MHTFMGSVGIIIALVYLIYVVASLIIVRRIRPNTSWPRNLILASVGCLILVLALSLHDEGAILWEIRAVGFWFGVLTPAVITAAIALGSLVRAHNMFERLRNWWRGEYQPATLAGILDESHPGQGKYIRPWPARLVAIAYDFWLKEWKWILGAVVGILGYFGLK